MFVSIHLSNWSNSCTSGTLSPGRRDGSTRFIVHWASARRELAHSSPPSHSRHQASSRCHASGGSRGEPALGMIRARKPASWARLQAATAAEPTWLARAKSSPKPSTLADLGQQRVSAPAGTQPASYFVQERYDRHGTQLPSAGSSIISPLLIYSYAHMLTGQARGPGTHIGGARAP